MLPEHMCLVLLGWSLPHPGLNAFRGFPSAWMVSPWGLLSRGMGLARADASSVCDSSAAGPSVPIPCGEGVGELGPSLCGVSC